MNDYDNMCGNSLCRVEVTLKRECYKHREDLWECRYRGKVLQVPMNRVHLELLSAMDITSLWTVILDFNEIESIKITCDNVRNPYDYNS